MSSDHAGWSAPQGIPVSILTGFLGAGKTTLARNLSVVASLDGRKVLCLDLDPQGSLRGWWESRQAETPAMLARDPTPHALRATLDAAKAQFDLCIIDTPPAAPEWLSEALGVADLVLIPVRPAGRRRNHSRRECCKGPVRFCPVSDAACADH